MYQIRLAGGPDAKHMDRFRSYNKWLKEKFGERVYKVIVDAGFTCPNRDGTVAVGGCAYCNNNSFRPPSAIKTDPIRDQVREGIEYIRKRFDANKFIIYFQPFTNTYAETEYLRQLYTDAIDHPEVVGLAMIVVMAAPIPQMKKYFTNCRVLQVCSSSEPNMYRPSMLNRR